jgi:hypothetical protein
MASAAAMYVMPLSPARLRREASASPIGKMLLVHQGCEFEIAIPGNDKIKVKPKQCRICATVQNSLNVWRFQSYAH